MQDATDTLPPDDPALVVARRLAAGIREVAGRARSEEDLRIGVEELLKPALRELGVDAEPRYEKSYAPNGSILRGRSDAVYGHLVIEYERVGSLARDAGVTHAAKQLDGYLRAEVAAELGREPEPRDLRRAIGVGLDGERIFFFRFRGDARATTRGPTQMRLDLPLFPDLAGVTRSEPADAYQVIGPFPVGDECVQQFLLYARALRRRPLTAQALADEFGPKGQAASRLVGALYAALLRAEHPKVKTFFREWDRIFGIVYGQDLAKAQRDAGELARAYGLDEGAALKPLLFAVHTYYALFMKLLAAELASLQRGSLISSFVGDLPSLPGRELRRQLDDLESGGLFGRLGIRNFLEADFFGWYLVMWRSDVEDGVRQLARALLDFEPATGSLEPAATQDLLKHLYQYLVPKELRHDLGEYYTPDWLAELVLDEAGYDGDLAKRVPLTRPAAPGLSLCSPSAARGTAPTSSSLSPARPRAPSSRTSLALISIRSPSSRHARTTSLRWGRLCGSSRRSRSPCTSATPCSRRRNKGAHR